MISLANHGEIKLIDSMVINVEMIVVLDQEENKHILNTEQNPYKLILLTIF